MKKLASGILLMILSVLLFTACQGEAMAIDKSLLSAMGMEREAAIKQLGLKGDESYGEMGFDPETSLHKSFNYGGRSLDTALGFFAHEGNTLAIAQVYSVYKSCTKEDIAYFAGLAAGLNKQFGQPEANVMLTDAAGTAAEEQFSIDKAEELYTRLASSGSQSRIYLSYSKLEGNYGMVTMQVEQEKDVGTVLRIQVSTQKSLSNE